MKKFFQKNGVFIAFAGIIIAALVAILIIGKKKGWFKAPLTPEEQKDRSRPAEGGAKNGHYDPTTDKARNIQVDVETVGITTAIGNQYRTKAVQEIQAALAGANWQQWLTKGYKYPEVVAIQKAVNAGNVLKGSKKRLKTDGVLGNDTLGAVRSIWNVKGDTFTLDELGDIFKPLN